MRLVSVVARDASDLEGVLVSELGLEPVQARTYLLVTCRGRMGPAAIAAGLGISEDAARDAARELVALGAFIDITEAEFEAMHPRFTAVNMLRRLCERRNVEFKRNKTVDGIGAILEGYYDDARTK